MNTGPRGSEKMIETEEDILPVTFILSVGSSVTQSRDLYYLHFFVTFVYFFFFALLFSFFRFHFFSFLCGIKISQRK